MTGLGIRWQLEGSIIYVIDISKKEDNRMIIEWLSQIPSYASQAGKTSPSRGRKILSPLQSHFQCERLWPTWASMSLSSRTSKRTYPHRWCGGRYGFRTGYVVPTSSLLIARFSFPDNRWPGSSRRDHRGPPHWRRIRRICWSGRERWVQTGKWNQRHQDSLRG